MKLLWLGTSNDAGTYLPDSQRAPQLAAAELGRLLETDVEVVARGSWPTRRLPSVVESWVERYQPDLVFLKVTAYPFCYESVPLKIERKLGWVGKPVADLGLKAANIGWLASNPAFHVARRLAQRTIGGVSPFEPEEVLERMSSCIRTIVRRENIALLVRGPRGTNDYGSSSRARRRSATRRAFVDDSLSELCSELHVTYAGRETRSEVTWKATTLGDRVHYDEKEQKLGARGVVPWLLRAWEEQQPRVC